MPKAAEKDKYDSNPEPKRAAARRRYASNPEHVKTAKRGKYASNPEPKKTAERPRYASNPEPKKTAARGRYASNPEPKRAAASKHAKYRSIIIQRQYYSCVAHRRAARLLQHARCRLRDNAKNKAYRQTNKQSILLARRGRYVLMEPKMDVKGKYVVNLQQCIRPKADIKEKLLQAFKSSCNTLSDKVKGSKLHVTRAVVNISSRKLLNRVLKVRKQSVGKLLQCIRSINALEITSASNVGNSRHTASSEPFFYDHCYQKVNHPSPIAVDSNGRCVIAEEEGERDAKTNRPTAWRCTPECKQPTSEEAQCILSIKKLFDKPVQTLREGLQIIDKCTLHGHYTCPVQTDNSGKPYYELAGHPLPCSQANSHCDSSLRILRAAATHFPVLRRFLILLYEAIRQHRLLDSIDTALCAGDFEKLLTICGIVDCKALFTACSTEDSASFKDGGNQPIRFQQPNLPDLETNLHLQHAELIADVKNKFALDAEFPCCSCDRLLLRKQVTAFKFSDSKFSSGAWKTLIQHNPNADSQTHYICQYCRPVLNKDDVPNRCILNGLITESMPKELERLDPLSKQLIQRGKAFQAVVKLGTYTGKIPSYNSLKACKGTMFFLPLPLDKTIQTIDDVMNSRTMSPVGLPDPELYIVVSGKPSKQKVLWQSMVNVTHVTAAIKKLKQINWLYANIDDASVGDACQRVIESISDTTSTMLVKATAEDVKSFQAYTIRWLDQKQSNLSDTEHYKLMNIKGDVLSNKLEHLDVLCFPTLFPSGRFGESHDRSTPISLSEYAKSRLLNKDSRFRKDSQYVFYLLWQKEMREIAAGVYNLMKGTRQHALPVGEFMDRVSNSDEDIEANLSTVSWI